ncbi:MAG: tetratricopeptide repeat protein, partial [Polyangiaceae bacterium]|nr:tetratricopeptide repeat protein [Polyangiaceae bacterium]
MMVLARDHYRAHRVDLALYTLRGILDGYGPANPARDPENGEAFYLRGAIYSEQGMKKQAMEELAYATELRPDLVEAHLILSTYMLEAGNAAGAKPHLEMVVRFNNLSIPGHLQLGDTYRLLGDIPAAKRELEWVIAADQQAVAAHYNLGLLYLTAKEVPGVSPLEAAEKAIEHLSAYQQKIPRGGPDDVAELLTRAQSKKAILELDAEGGDDFAEGDDGFE